MRVLALAALLLAACAPGRPDAVVRLPFSGNPVVFDPSVASIASRDEVVVYLDELVAGRLPGVGFLIVPYPAMTPDGRTCTSYRHHGPDAYVVLSWWGVGGRAHHHDDGPPVLPSGWSIGDAPWEVSHLLAGTDDDGRPIGGTR